MEPVECEGRTVAEAVEAALSKCGLRRDQVEISVLQEGAAGFMGLGAKPARVRLTEKRWGPDTPAARPSPAHSSPKAAASRPARPAAPPRAVSSRPAARAVERAPERTPERSPKPAPRSRPDHSAPPRQLTTAEASEVCSRAEKLVLEVLGLMSIAAPAVSSSWDAGLERVKLSVESQDASLLVSHDGRVLESLQFLATLMLSRGNEAPLAVQVDALSYWEKREAVVLDAARNAIDVVKATGKPVRMEPMDSSMRRLIHRTFSSHPDITTGSEGEGPWRKLVIRARNG